MKVVVSSALTLLVVFLLMGFTVAQDEKIRDPRAHPNLSPFEQWRSSYDCLLNVSESCGNKYQLTAAGWVNVTSADTTSYCKGGGCADHTRALLSCLRDVMRDYKFQNKARVKDINDTITAGCLSGFTGEALPLSN